MGSNPSLIRKYHQQKVLNLVRSRGYLSKKQISDIVEISLSAAGNIVDDLVSLEYLKIKKRTGGGGRGFPTSYYCVDDSGLTSYGVVIYPDKIELSSMGLKGSVKLLRKENYYDEISFIYVLKSCSETIKNNNSSKRNISGIGVTHDFALDYGMVHDPKSIVIKKTTKNEVLNILNDSGIKSRYNYPEICILKYESYFSKMDSDEHIILFLVDGVGGVFVKTKSEANFMDLGEPIDGGLMCGCFGPRGRVFVPNMMKKGGTSDEHFAVRDGISPVGKRLIWESIGQQLCAVIKANRCEFIVVSGVVDQQVLDEVVSIKNKDFARGIGNYECYFGVTGSEYLNRSASVIPFFDILHPNSSVFLS